MKTKVIQGVSVILIVVLSAAIFLYVDKVLILKRSDGITPMQNLYAQKENTIDVLLLGSSHVGMNLDTEVLWTEYGISSYALWGSVQPFWNSYHFLVEALKNQSPKVVVLDVYAATMQFEYSDDARQVTNVCGMNLSSNKINAIKVSAPQERWLNLLIGLPIYHQRYAELTSDDFKHFPWTGDLINQKGTSYRYGVGDYSLQDVSSITQSTALYPKEEEYLRKTIELSQSLEIPLVLIKTPSADRLGEQPYYNSVAQIATEYNIPFYNFNLMDQKTGLTAEDYWTDGHLNTNGSRKVTSYLGGLLQSEYNISDHRGDNNYESWNTNAQNIQNNYIKKISDTEDYFNELARSERAVFVIKNSKWPDSKEYLYLLDQMKKIGIDSDEIYQSSGGDWILTSTQNGEFINQYNGDMYSEFEYSGVKFTADFYKGTGISINGNSLYHLNGPGIICLVYDPNTQSCTDIATFLVDDEFKLIHPSSH